ncbi:MAG: SDR family NAD(P)-dependent oxidoreductase [Thermoplasmatota archaeon]
MKDGQIALITGGYKNLGLSISRTLKEAGFIVIASFRTERAKALEISEKYGIPVYRADITSVEEIEELFKTIEDDFGSVSVLVNNASSFPVGSLMDTSQRDFEDAFRSSVFASNFMIKRAVPGMSKAGEGAVVNIGMSGIGEVKGYSDIAPHASAKTALAVLTLSWAKEVSGRGISVNMVSPGIIDYPWRSSEWRKGMRALSTSGKLTPPEEVSRAVLFLVQNRSITGKNIEVDPTFEPAGFSDLDFNDH